VQVLAIILISFFTLSAVLNVSLVGKRREPLTAGTAAVSVIIHLALIIALVILAF